MSTREKDSTEDEPGRAHYTISSVCLGPFHSRVAAAGALDPSAAEDLSVVLDEENVAGSCFVQLDLSDVTFLSNACLGVLVLLHDRYHLAHSTLVLTGLSPQIKRLLTLTGLDNILLTAPYTEQHSDPGLDPAIAEGGVRPRCGVGGNGAHESARLELSVTQFVIEQAAGIVMGRRGCNREQAAKWLQLEVISTNRNLAEVAASIVDDTSGLRRNNWPSSAPVGPLVTQPRTNATVTTI